MSGDPQHALQGRLYELEEQLHRLDVRAIKSDLQLLRLELRHQANVEALVLRTLKQRAA